MSVFLTAEWRHLLMVNYVVDPAVLEAATCPPGPNSTSGTAGPTCRVVGFQFLRTKVLGVADPVPPELRRGEPAVLRPPTRRRTSWRQGVVVRQGARAAAGRSRGSPGRSTTRTTSACRCGRKSSVPGPRAVRWWHAGAWERGLGDRDRRAVRACSGSEETFITEHYWGYARQRDGSTVEYAVEHEPWRVWRCEAAVLACQVASSIRCSLRAVPRRGRRARHSSPTAPPSSFDRGVRLR